MTSTFASILQGIIVALLGFIRIYVRESELTMRLRHLPMANIVWRGAARRRQAVTNAAPETVVLGTEQTAILIFWGRKGRIAANVILPAPNKN
jgi:hypothetical protein